MSTSTQGKQPRASGSHRSSRTKPPTTPQSSKQVHSEGVDEPSNPLAIGDRPYTPRRPRATSTSSQSIARTPARSFYHRSFHGQLDPAQYSSEGLRDQTAELASFALSDNATFLPTTPPRSPSPSDDGHPEAIAEVSEPTSRDGSEHGGDQSVSNLTKMIQNTPPNEQHMDINVIDADLMSHPTQPGLVAEPETLPEPDEHTSLLSDRKTSVNYGDLSDLERQHIKRHGLSEKLHSFRKRVTSCGYTLIHPKTWSKEAIYREAIAHPVSLIPAVFLGLLLNILDALSYGMILFPLGHAVFEGLGSDGIAIYYVSTIIAQVVFSAGGSVFRGGIGSEMIEVVPFFHKMAYTILERVGEDNPKAVLATTVLAYAVSALITGAVFFLMGACGLGSLIGFFPRHILIGCIGGVGWFLVATGVEVSARLPGNLEYNLGTVKQLIRSDTVLLWTVPLVLAIVLSVLQRFVKSNMLVGGYFVSIAALFYFFKFALDIQMDTLHSRGWVFDSPPAGNPWYHFYTLYDFKIVDWEALIDTVPAMFALTFFGVLHVPINVPALGISTGEDNLSVDRELIAHGVSNCLSGLFGSVQNYLVYTNSLLFMDSGGDDRLAGLMLAAATFGILLAGPVIIGYIPIMVVGALIFLLGMELLEEALVGTWGKVHKLEYATIVIIVVTMGVWDFVIGILVGIILAALNFVVQTSRRTAIRATYSGEIANSTVRRPPMQLKYLKEAGRQIFVIKLTGFLFFGTIVGVENRIRALLEEEAFNNQPLKFLVMDMTHINGVDFSAAEAFTRINRLLQKKGVQLIVSGLDIEAEIGRALQNVGLFEEELNVEIFANLNEALQHCENKLLTTLYRQQERRRSRRPASNLEVPHQQKRSGDFSQSYTAEFMISSPRGNQLHQAAKTTLDEESTRTKRWSGFKQPLPLLLQMFEGLSDKGEDFWYRVLPYFTRVTYPKGSVLFNVGDRPNGFYVLEEGMMRAEYELPQGNYSELVVAGRPYGELPFFSETARTATMVAEKDSVAWELDGPNWKELQTKESEVAQELLKICLKLTKERMDVITSYVLTTAG